MMLRLVKDTGSARLTPAQQRANMLADLAKAGFALRDGRVSLATTNAKRSAFERAKEQRS